MRKAIRLGVALLAAASASSCASPMGQPTATSGAAAVMPAQGSASPGFFGSVTGAFHNGATAMVSFVTPAPQHATTVDPTSLSTKSGKATPDLHIAMAEMQEKLGHADQAREQYDLALKESPHHLGALMGLAHLLDRQGKLPEATPKYELACKYHPKEARPFNDLGLCYFRQHKFNEAAKSLTKAVELEPEKPLYRNNLATVLTEMGRPDDAFVQLKEVQGPAVAHYNVGYLLYQKGNRAGAAYHFAEASKADPSLVAARQWSEQLAAELPASTPVEMPAPAPVTPVRQSHPVARTVTASRPASASVQESYAAPIVTIGEPLRREVPVNAAPVVTPTAPVATATPFVPEPADTSSLTPAPSPSADLEIAPAQIITPTQPSYAAEPMVPAQPLAATEPIIPTQANVVVQPNNTTQSVVSAPAVATSEPVEPFYHNALRAKVGEPSSLRRSGATADDSRPATDFISPRIATLPRPLPAIDQSESRDR